MRPNGLLLDFGGVIVESTYNDDWHLKVADELEKIFGDELASCGIDRQRLEIDVFASETSVKLLRNAQARPLYSRDLSHTEYVLDYLGADWPASLHPKLAQHADRICYLIASLTENRVMRPGTVELLEWCKERTIPVGIVSNALSGQVHRDWLKDAGILGYFTAEVYSDEVGVRKPDPRLVWIGAERIGVPVEECWYVGDHLDRDVLCGNRAGAGASVLMPAPNAAKRPFKVYATPDVTVADPAGLLEVLKEIEN